MSIVECTHTPVNGSLPITPRPLTRCNGSGELYVRSLEVETEITSALQMDWRSLSTRIEISDSNAPDFLQEESLVYFIREALHQKQYQAFRNIFKALHTRCVKYVHSHLSSFPPHRIDDAFQNVISYVVSKIMDLEDDSGDFFQVRFWLALKRAMLTEYGKQVKEIEVEEDCIRIDQQLEGDEGDEPSFEIADTSLSQEDLALIKSGLSVLTEPYKTAFLLRYYNGWPIRSNDPTEITISSHFNKTPRTVQNWLDTAEGELVKWREEKTK
jgi:DNA-directed RNA polymerase specialized sigma24 family protein